MKKEFEQIFSTLKNSNQEEIRIAKKQLDKLWHKDRKKFKKNGPFVLQQLKDFDNIKNPKNQEAFVSGLNLFFLVLADTHFNQLKEFTLKVICHQNGHVREQMRKTADWLYISLSSRIHPFVWPEGKKLNQKQIEEQEKAKDELVEYLSGTERLMELYDDGSNDDVKFIDKLKPSVYKSLQMLWSDLNRGKLLQYLHSPSLEILARRAEIEKQLLLHIKRSKDGVSVEDIMNIIYEETDTNELSNLIQLFNIKSLSEMQEIVNLLNDAWNYFPHKVLNGLCPMEVINKKMEPKLPN
jgi:hypothetical protein